MRLLSLQLPPRATAPGPNRLVPSPEERLSCLSCLSCLSGLTAFRETHGNLLGLRPVNRLKSAKRSWAGANAQADAALHVPTSLF